MAKNILGDDLIPCSTLPMTGFSRTGCCAACTGDYGVHTVCVVMDRTFLAFSRSRGNDLVTPRPEHAFPGLRPGDRWCLCAPRWQQALVAGCAPRVVLAATHIATVEFCDRADLLQHAYDASPDPS